MSQPNSKNGYLQNSEILVYSLLVTFILTWHVPSETKRNTERTAKA